MTYDDIFVLFCRPANVCLTTLQDLLHAKADPNIADNVGRTALSWAVTNKIDTNSTPLKLCTALLDGGADVNSADKKQRTPLHYSINYTTGGFETITEVEDLLIKYGANTVALDLHNRIPLHYAFVKMNNGHTDYSMSDPISVVSLLCEAITEQGKDAKTQVNHQDNFGQTPLHRAALRGATICSLNLLQKGGSLEIKDNDGNTPLSLALRERHDGCAMMFMQSNAPPSCPVIRPLTPEDWKTYEKQRSLYSLTMEVTLSLLLCFLSEQSPSSLDIADNDGVTPFAAVFSKTESGIITLVEFFVSPANCHVKKLDVCYSVRDSKGDSGSHDTTTPLIEAALSNSEKVVMDLLKHGASVNFPKVIDNTATAPCHNPILIPQRWSRN
ncbi:probable protein S-acyltransferase 23 [Orbicella faveolata]|uniref:probable protein S-acyltransferase 23 n=1 Tax=Orbicella faveolata TaxID=48498 RepID=UPI0009E4185A|nr:probable protein S-acyltransferase 23 [Orbicella faveolata]